MKNWGIRSAIGGIGVIAGSLIGIAMICGFQKPWIETVQHGPRGTGMDLIYNDQKVADDLVTNKVPGYLPKMPAVGQKASVAYKNVKVLGDLSVVEFTRLMASITQWVAPTQGCNYCHNPDNMAEDTHYTKVVSRRMLQMTQNINQNWTSHVAATGVTCYTCHHGNNIPSNLWVNTTLPLGADSGHGFAATTPGKNAPAVMAGLTSLPSDPFTPFLEQAANIRVEGTTALPNGDKASIKQTDWTYALMMHASDALGVNCTFCHNTRSFANWEQSPPQRVTAWYGIRMVRELNVGYMNGLASVFPANRKGPMGDVGKVNCTTCHLGAFKPLLGVSMAKDFPELLKVSSANGGPKAP